MSFVLKASVASLLVLLGASHACAQSQSDNEQRMRAALARLHQQRSGIVDAYVVVAPLDAAPVLGREAREAARGLARRFRPEGRTVVLSHADGRDKAHAEAPQ